MANKRLQDYVKFEQKELDSYVANEGSCVYKVNEKLHALIGPYCLKDFKQNIHEHLVRKKVGYYDKNLQGIIIDIKNIKVLGSVAAIRGDDPRIHVNLQADCYVFRPQRNAVLNGVVKHVGAMQVGVILYRVFNANIRFQHKLVNANINIDETLNFRIKDFNIQSALPYLEGNLLTENMKDYPVSRKRVRKSANSSHTDSGIEDQDGMLSTVKDEPESDRETTSIAQGIEENSTNKTKKSKKAEKTNKIATTNGESNILSIIENESQSDTELLTSLNENSSKKSKKPKRTAEPVDEPHNAENNALSIIKSESESDGEMDRLMVKNEPISDRETEEPMHPNSDKTSKKTKKSKKAKETSQVVIEYDEDNTLSLTKDEPQSDKEVTQIVATKSSKKNKKSKKVEETIKTSIHNGETDLFSLTNNNLESDSQNEEVIVENTKQNSLKKGNKPKMDKETTIMESAKKPAKRKLSLSLADEQADTPKAKSRKKKSIAGVESTDITFATPTSFSKIKSVVATPAQSEAGNNESLFDVLESPSAASTFIKIKNETPTPQKEKKTNSATKTDSNEVTETVKKTKKRKLLESLD